ncbi:MAG TPA: response regulator transcription factor [Vicinamibacterales bacterium]|nr:response regulator transcription factor [Vicinamibacterales bacterium]
MRIVLVGPPGLRERFRKAQAPFDSAQGRAGAGVVIVAEGDTPVSVQAAAARADAVVVLEAPPAADDSRDDSSIEALTPREREVLELLAEGMSNKAIAARLLISDQTVKFHVASISGKLGAANRTEAVRRALRRGLLHV